MAKKPAVNPMVKPKGKGKVVPGARVGKATSKNTPQKKQGPASKISKKGAVKKGGKRRPTKGGY